MKAIHRAMASLRDLLPWRFRSVNNFVAASPNMLFVGVLRSAPVPVNRASPFEIHSLVCHRDVNMMLTSAKSFLRFCPEMAFIVHDDGSLTTSDRDRLRGHLPGVEIIDRVLADRVMKDKLPAAVFAQRQRHVFLMKLFDFNHFHTGTHTILLDSDIVFLSRPDEVIEWLSREDARPFYNKDWCPSYRAKTVPPAVDLPPSLNAGFMGYSGRFSMEEIYKWCFELDYWLEDQTLYALLLAGRGAEPLDPQRYMVYTGQPLTDRAVMVHFISPSRFRKFLYPRLAARVASQLG